MVKDFEKEWKLAMQQVSRKDKQIEDFKVYLDIIKDRCKYLEAENAMLREFPGMEVTKEDVTGRISQGPMSEKIKVGKVCLTLAIIDHHNLIRR